MTSVRRSVLRVTGIGSLIVLLSTTPATAADLDVPVLGQAHTLGLEKSGSPAVITIHGVRRLDRATIVYWSLARPKDSDPTFALASGYLGTNTTDLSRTDAASALGDVGLLDASAGKLYRPMVDGREDPNCVCSWDPAVQLDPGQAGVLWSAVSPLPAQTTTVDVYVGEQVIPGVKVEQGPMEPAIDTPNQPILVGTGWPKPREEVMAKAVPADPAFYTVTQRVSDLERTVTESRGEVALAADVLFAKDSATLGAPAKAAIAKAAQKIKAAKTGKALTVTGHTDSDASTSYNMTLSKKRAEAVAASLKAALGPGYTISAQGKGETQPIADNTSAEGKAKNRRVSITFTEGA